MLIEDIRTQLNRDTHIISGSVDGYALTYSLPRAFAAKPNANAFLAAAFFPAALTGETVTVSREHSVSPRLVRGITHLQQIFLCWNPDLQPFDILSRHSTASPANAGTAAFFSGGIDGLYTLFKNRNEITHLIYVNGFDFRIPDDAFAAQIKRLKRIAEAFGKTLVPVDTNFFEFNHYYNLRRTLSHGSCLASVAHALGFQRYYIPASYTYNELHPWGTHPLVDNHWSTEGSELIHDGADASRLEKTEKISESRLALDNLIVCWRLPDRNCGECGKCLRTRIALRLFSAETETFAAPPTYREVAKCRPESEEDRLFYLEELVLARRVGDRSMERALEKVTRAPMVRDAIKEVDRRLFNNALLQRYRKMLRKAASPRPRVTGLTPKNTKRGIRSF